MAAVTRDIDDLVRLRMFFHDFDIVDLDTAVEIVP